MPQDNCEILRNWAKAHGAAVRQRTVRQETTMAKHGTMPEYMYQRRNIVTERVDVFSDNNPSATEDVDVRVEEVEEAIDSDAEENLDEVDEFDSSSDEEEDDEGLELPQADHDEIGKSTDILFGARSRYGRAVRFNNRLLF